MKLPFVFEMHGGFPVHDQIVKSVKRAVLTGKLVDGENFPTIRVLAQELRISPTTAHKAVLELRDTGFLSTRRGSRIVVVMPPGSSQEHLFAQIAPACRSLVREASRLGMTAEEILAAVSRTLSEAVAQGGDASRDPE